MVQLAGTADADSARLDADLLAAVVTGRSRTQLFAHPDALLEAAHRAQLDALLQRRLAGEPLAYLTGTREFWSLPLQVAPGVLVPRPDSETLVEKAIELEASLPDGFVLDLGTGTAAIAIALANELPTRTVIAIEKSQSALPIALSNIQQLARNPVHLLQANWLDAIDDASAAMIIANPPYLAEDDPHLPELRHEPKSALVSGQSGLEDLAQIIEDATRVGIAGSVVIVEHGCDQGSAVRELMSDHHYQAITTGFDLAGRDRISYGYLMDNKT